MRSAAVTLVTFACHAGVIPRHVAARLPSLHDVNHRLRCTALVLSYLNRRLREAMATPIHINFVRIVLIVPICKLLTVPKRREVASIYAGTAAAGPRN